MKYHSAIKDAADSANTLPCEEPTHKDNVNLEFFLEHYPYSKMTIDDIVRLRMFCDRLPIGVLDYIRHLYK